MISICIFTWGFTREVCNSFVQITLWIDFNLYFYVRIHKTFKHLKHRHVVVNWFQFVFLREDSQGRQRNESINGSCELISICIFTWGFTSTVMQLKKTCKLWIDFNLYFYVRIHKIFKTKVEPFSVVNWFQFVFLREDSQEKVFCDFQPFSCELISICIFTWGFTRIAFSGVLSYVLWIDFNLYFYVRIHKKRSS